MALFLPLVVLCRTALAHPVPDIPVRSSFTGNGSVTIRVEVDPRCFAEDPLNEPYLENGRLKSIEREKMAELLSKTAALIKDSIEFWVQPVGRLAPEFKTKFTTFANKPLIWSSARPAESARADAQMPVVITAEWIADASQWSSYQIKATTNGQFSVRVINDVNGKEQPLNVLFPGEQSYKLDLTSWVKTNGLNSNGGNKE